MNSEEPDIRQDQREAEMRLAVLQPHIDLLYNVAHDLRSAFGTISGLTSLLLLSDNTDEQRDMLIRLKSNTNYAVQIFTCLQDYSLLETADMRPSISPFRPGLMFADIQRRWAAEAGRRNINLEIYGDQEMTIDGDHDKVRKIAENLVFYTIFHLKAKTMMISWDKTTHGWHFVFAYLGEAPPASATSGWEASSTDDNAGSQDDVSLKVAKKMVHLLGVSTQLVSHATQTGFTFTFRQ